MHISYLLLNQFITLTIFNKIFNYIFLNDNNYLFHKMNGVTEWYCTPYEVTEENFIKAILDTDEYSKNK